MSNKSNIFAVLPQDHSDDEDNHGGQQARKEKKQNNKKDTGKVEEKPAQAQKTQEKAGKDDHKKNKKVPEPGTHPLDRHSGTGQAAFDKKNSKKGGHGKGNVGVATKETEEETKAEETTEEQPQEEAKPEGITLEEYYSQTAQSSANQVDQAKLKQVQDELTKDLLSKKGTLYVKKTAEEEKPVARKTAKANIDHHAALNTEHADLLNFRTGFVEYKERTERPKPAPKKEEKTEEAPAEGEKVEKAEKAEGEAPAEGEKAEDNKEKRGGRGGYRGNNRGENRGDKGGKRGGYKGGNNHHNKSGQPKINFEDDSAFPKLG